MNKQAEEDADVLIVATATSMASSYNAVTIVGKTSIHSHRSHPH